MAPLPALLGTDSLAPTALVERGSRRRSQRRQRVRTEHSFAGVVGYLEEKGIGIEFGNATIPIVSGAILFDLGTRKG